MSGRKSVIEFYQDVMRDSVAASGAAAVPAADQVAADRAYLVLAAPILTALSAGPAASGELFKKLDAASWAQFQLALSQLQAKGLVAPTTQTQGGDAVFALTGYGKDVHSPAV